MTTPPARSFIAKLVDSPLTAAWLLAVAISALVAVLVLAPKHRFAARPAPTTNGKDVAVESPKGQASEQLPFVEPIADPSIVIQTPETPTKSDQEIISISALEPANLDVPISSPPVEISPNMKQEQTAIVVVPSRPHKPVKESLLLELDEYKQTKPVSRRELIVTTLHELLDAPIEFDADELGADELDKKITFEIGKKISIGDLIKAVTEPAGWQMEIEPTGLRIRRKKN